MHGWWSGLDIAEGLWMHLHTKHIEEVVHLVVVGNERKEFKVQVVADYRHNKHCHR